MENVSPEKKRRRVGVDPEVQDVNICNTLERYNSVIATSGTIKSIKLENFMCHGNFEISLNPGVNFVTGLNGSGKSAIQTAIVVGLGGRALTTNRSLSLKGLIKQNCPSASVDIILNNGGSNSYQKDIFGNQIIVRRHIPSSGTATYKIYSKTGKLIYSKKDQLDLLLTHFHIQVNNPVAILNQDMSKTFFNNVDAKERYALFKKATLIEEAQVLLNQIVEALRYQENLLESKEKAIEFYFREIKEMETKLDHLENLKTYKNQKSQLEIDLKITKKNELVQTKENLQSKCENQVTAKNNLEISLQKVEQIITDHENELKICQENLSNVNSITQRKEEEYQATQNELKQHRLTYTFKYSQLKNLTEKLNRKKIDLTHIQKLICDEERYKNENAERERQCLQKLNELQEDIKNLEGESTLCEASHLNAKALETNYMVSLKEQQNLLKECKNNLDTNILNMEMLQKSKHNIHLYGSWMETLLQHINNANQQGKFTCTPRGPIGSYIQVIDKNWIFAIENFFKRSVLSAFYVNDFKDCTFLYQIMEKVIPKNEAKPVIYTGKFCHCLYDSIIEKEVVCCPYTNMYRALAISDPVVANFLIDTRSIETILLIPDNKDCYDLSRPENVPSRCKKALNMEGDEFFPHPNFKCYSNLQLIRPRFLQPRISHIITSLEQENVEYSKLIKELTIKIDSIQSHLQQQNVEVKQFDNLLEKLISEICVKKQELRKNHVSFDNEMCNLKQHQNELIIIEQEVTNLQEQLDVLNFESDACSKNIKECEKRLILIKKECFTSQRYMVEKKISNLKACLVMENTDRHVIMASIKNQESKITFIQSKIASMEKLLQKFTPFVENRELQVLRPIAAVEQELNLVNACIQEMEHKLDGISVNYEKELWEKKEAHQRLKDLLEKVKAHYQKLKDQHGIREHTFRDTRLNMANKVLEHFLEILRSRNYEGNLQFNHNQEKLKVHLATTNIRNSFLATSLLSGGERSFTTVAFIMALWTTMDLAFYSMDEFDVYMDALNRKAITDLIISYSLEHSSTQYIFLTPLDISNISSHKNLDVHRLKNPRD